MDEKEGKRRAADDTARREDLIDAVVFFPKMIIWAVDPVWFFSELLFQSVAAKKRKKRGKKRKKRKKKKRKREYNQLY